MISIDSSNKCVVGARISETVELDIFIYPLFVININMLNNDEYDILLDNQWVHVNTTGNSHKTYVRFV